MRTQLDMPSRELAEKLLAEVPYDKRLTGVMMQCLSGPSAVDLYSVDQAAAFLHADSLEALRDPVSGASYGYIDPKALAWWLENVFGDTELAVAIESAAAEYQHYLGQLEPMQELLVARLRQCDEVAEPARAAG